MIVSTAKLSDEQVALHVKKCTCNFNAPLTNTAANTNEPRVRSNTDVQDRTCPPPAPSDRSVISPSFVRPMRRPPLEHKSAPYTISSSQTSPSEGPDIFQYLRGRTLLAPSAFKPPPGEHVPLRSRVAAIETKTLNQLRTRPPDH